MTLLFLEIPRKAATPPPELRANRFLLPRTMTTRTKATPKLLPQVAPRARGTRSAGASDQARSLLDVNFWHERTSSFSIIFPSIPSSVFPSRCKLTCSRAVLCRILAHDEPSCPRPSKQLRCFRIKPVHLNAERDRGSVPCASTRTLILTTARSAAVLVPTPRSL